MCPSVRPSWHVPGDEIFALPFLAKKFLERVRDQGIRLFGDPGLATRDQSVHGIDLEGLHAAMTRAELLETGVGGADIMTMSPAATGKTVLSGETAESIEEAFFGGLEEGGTHVLAIRVDVELGGAKVERPVLFILVGELSGWPSVVGRGGMSLAAAYSTVARLIVLIRT